MKFCPIALFESLKSSQLILFVIFTFIYDIVIFYKTKIVFIYNITHLCLYF